MTPEHRALIDRIRSSAAVVRRAVGAAPPGRFGLAPRPGEWSALETLTHLRDVVVHVYGLRIRRLLYEDAPVFADFDEETYRRASLARGEAIYQGRPQRVRWSDSAIRARIPISICAEGPRMLHLGGRIGDGVIAGTGLLPEVIRDTVARIHAGAHEAGRDPAQVDIWFTTRNALDADHDTAIERVKASVSSILNHSMRFGLDGKLVPEELRATVQEYVDGYVLYDHVLQAGQNPKRMDELGLTDYALRRFALAGTPRDWIARIAELAEAGATKLWVGLGGSDLDRQRHDLRMLGEEIMPHFVA